VRKKQPSSFFPRGRPKHIMTRNNVSAGSSQAVPSSQLGVSVGVGAMYTNAEMDHSSQLASRAPDFRSSPLAPNMGS
jgi:hypothetical protein